MPLLRSVRTSHLGVRGERNRELWLLVLPDAAYSSANLSGLQHVGWLQYMAMEDTSVKVSSQWKPDNLQLKAKTKLISIYKGQGI